MWIENIQLITPLEKSSLPSNLEAFNLEALKAYRLTILTALSLPPFKDGATWKRNVYETEMFSTLAYEYEKLHPVEQKDFKKEFKALLKMSRERSVAQKARKDFLEDWQELLPLTFWYQSNDYQQYYLPRKNSLQAFYDTYLDAA